MPSRRSVLIAGAGLALTGCAGAAQSDGQRPSPSASATTTSASPTPSAASTTATPTPSPSSATPSASATFPAELDGLAPLLAQRFLDAQAGAAAAGLTLTLTSGYRDPAYQQQLFDAKVAAVGSVAEAEKWVLPPDKSEHCKGMAIDIGPTSTEMQWLTTNCADYGLCRRYVNEPWHFELRYPDGSAPAMLDNASEG